MHEINSCIIYEASVVVRHINQSYWVLVNLVQFLMTFVGNHPAALFAAFRH